MSNDIMVPRRPVEILLVEDNPGDVRLTIEGLKDSKVRHRLTVMPDGREAMDFLMRRGSYETARRPDLILLDLNLPAMDGRELLGIMKPDLALRSIPVVVLTSSEAQQDVVNAYDLGANCYLVKPVTFVRILDLLHRVGDFWLESVRLPPNPEA